jgi:predicted ABC-type ATPase
MTAFTYKAEHDGQLVEVGWRDGELYGSPEAVLETAKEAAASDQEFWLPGIGGFRPDLSKHLGAARFCGALMREWGLEATFSGDAPDGDAEEGPTDGQSLIEWMEERNPLLERDTTVEPYTRASGVRVSGYHRVLNALADLENPLSPVSSVHLPNGQHVRSTGDGFEVHIPDKGPTHFPTAHAVAVHVGATQDPGDVGGEPGGPMERTRAETAMKDVRTEAATNFEERARGFVEDVDAGSLAETRELYGNPGPDYPENEDSWEYTDPDRVDFHERAVNAALEGVEKPTDRKPRCVMMMGGPAAGKGTIKRTGSIDFLGPPGSYADVDPDAFKEVIPEYNLMTGLKRADASSRAHEESSMLAKKTAEVALHDQTDFLLDGTGGSKSWFSRLEHLKELGTHDLQIVLVTKPVDEAVKGAATRAESTGRVVPEDFIRAKYQQIADSWDRVTKTGVPVQVWDRTDEITRDHHMDDPGRLIAEVDAEGNVTVHDEEAMAAFLAHGTPPGA